jgi:multicomponent Na+:H+ antiporter subunit D
MNSVPPGLILVAGAILLGFSPRAVRSWVFIVVGLCAILQITLALQSGSTQTLHWLTMNLMPLRVDELSLVFAYVFGVLLVIGGIYAVHIYDRGQQIASLLYGGGALGVVFAGDLLTLVIFWELMAVASSYLIFAGASESFTRDSHRAGIRYLFVHLVGGSLLLGGVLWHLGDGGGMAFDLMSSHPATWLILLGFAINAAIPPLHAWLADTYPESSVTGSIFLSGLTTKTAVYVLARGFAGWDILIPLGVAMAILGVVFAVLENDIRRLLAYHIISQVGYMVAAVGIGTEAAINGASAHAFAHVLYKGLLFMGAGAVLYATGKSRLTELGGLARQMPITFGLYMVGALSISAFPLFSGFVSKSMVLHAAEQSHITWVVFILYVASVGTFLHTGLKLPYFTWLGTGKTKLTRNVPPGMHIAMGIAAVLCIAIGVYPRILYDLLPYPTHYAPYTSAHVIHSLQMLGFTVIGFWLLRKKLGGETTVTLDTDWFYRKAGRAVEYVVRTPLEKGFTMCQVVSNKILILVSRFTEPPESGWAQILRALGLQRYLGTESSIRTIGRPSLSISIGLVLTAFAVFIVALALS